MASELLATGAMVDERRKAVKGGRPHGLQSMPQIDPSLAPVVEQVYQQYPALAKYRDQFSVIQGRPMIPGDDRQLESYPIEESWNPMPGHYTTELYNSAIPPAEQATMIAGDFLHFLPHLDPKWEAMKRDVVPKELQANDRLYNSRADEWLMGYLTPDADDHWRKGGAYKPDQVKKLDAMKAYLQGSDLLPTGAR
jgi:hypothetical protein